MSLHPIVVQALHETGLPWSIEPGRKHDKLILNGRQVSVIPHGRAKKEADMRGHLNQRAEVRRAARTQ